MHKDKRQKRNKLRCQEATRQKRKEETGLTYERKIKEVIKVMRKIGKLAVEKSRAEKKMMRMRGEN